MLQPDEKRIIKKLLIEIQDKIDELKDISNGILYGRGFGLESIEKERLGVNTSAIQDFVETTNIKIKNLTNIVEIKW